MTCPMERLPPEVVCYILSKLDGHSLACAAKVCQRWHGMVGILGKGFNIWHKRCLQEFGLDKVVAQTGLTVLLTRPGQTAADSRKEDWEFWRGLYATNHHCDCVGSKRWNRLAEAVDKREGVITALDLLPPTATDSGMVCTGMSGYFHGGKLDKDWFSTYHSRRHGVGHLNGCTDMTTVALGGCPGYSAHSGTKQTTLFVSTGIQGCVKVNDLGGHELAELKPRNHQAYCVSSLGPYFVVGHDVCITQGLVIYKAVMVMGPTGRGEPRTSPVSLLPVTRLSGLMHSDVKAVALSHKQVVAGDGRGILYSWEIPSLSNFDGMSPDSVKQLEVEQPCQAIQLRSCVEQVLLHHGQVIALSSVGQGKIFVVDNEDWSKMSVIGEEKLNALSGNSGYVKCLAASGSLLALGCRSGKILLFRIASKTWTSNLKRNLVSCFSANMTDLQTLKFSDDGRGTVLLAGGSGMHAFRWRRRDTQAGDHLDLSTCSVSDTHTYS